MAAPEAGHYLPGKGLGLNALQGRLRIEACEYVN